MATTNGAIDVSAAVSNVNQRLRYLVGPDTGFDDQIRGQSRVVVMRYVTVALRKREALVGMHRRPMRVLRPR